MSRKLRIATALVGSGLVVQSFAPAARAQTAPTSSMTLGAMFVIPNYARTSTTQQVMSAGSLTNGTIGISQFHPDWGTLTSNGTPPGTMNWAVTATYDTEALQATWSWNVGTGANQSSGSSIYSNGAQWASTAPPQAGYHSSGADQAFGSRSASSGSAGYGIVQQQLYNQVSCTVPPDGRTGDVVDVSCNFSGSWQLTYNYTPSHYWTGNGSGSHNWSDSANWAGTTAPNGAGQSGYLGDTTGGTAVTLDSAVTLGSLLLDSATSSYTIGGGNALTIQDGNGALLTVQRGSHTISAPVAFASNTTADIEGSSNTLTLSGGTSLGSGVAVTKQGAGTISVSGDLKVGDGHTSTFTHAGGGVSVGGTLYVGYGTGGAGTYTLAGGTLSASSDVNVAAGSTFEYDGGTLTANVDNSGRFNVRNGGTRTVTGNFVNEAGATLKTYGTTFRYTGTFTNNGTYFSDPADNYFNTLTVGRTGALKGGVGDRFFVSGDLRSASANAAGWDTRGAQLIFEGGTGSHVLDVTGADLGPTAAGYAGNFAWGTLTLAAGDALALRDGNAAPGGGLYLGKLDLTGGLGQIADISAADGLNVYYDPALNPLLADGTYALSGGGLLEPAQGLSPELSASLAAVPEPGCVGLLLAASALLARRARR